MIINQRLYCCGSGSRNRTTSSCSTITTATLTEYLDAYNCVQNNDLETQVDMTEDYVQYMIVLLTNAIIDKQNNPNSCSYSQSISTFQTDLNKIHANTDLC